MSTKLSAIRILEKDPNKMGDLFGRLMQDLFLALGYDQARLNIHKSGREIDLEALHRTEKGKVIAECKATKEKTGGDEVNKFVGSLDVERRKGKSLNIVGYYVSIAGFKETAIEQEREAGDERVVLLNGTRIVEELVKGNIVVSLTEAMERAGRSAASMDDELKPETDCELLAHEMGWIWLIYFLKNRERKYFALIHADGEALGADLAKRIIEDYKSTVGDNGSVAYLAPPVSSRCTEDEIKEAKEKYYGYLASECGEITLEGLPADQEVGARRLRLENIFVPLYLQKVEDIEEKKPASSGRYFRREREDERVPVGKVLEQESRLAILSAPGGGKTTLLKRVAIAYAFPDRSGLVEDNLPQRNWIPFFVRCRQLGELVKSPISKVLQEIPHRAEIEGRAEAFTQLVRRSLQNGEALVLIDGLDEISNEGERVDFVHQLRTFLATYPRASMVVTSREAGFRIVGGTLSRHCSQYRISDFSDEDIKRLTVAWHKEVVGDKEAVKFDAEKLAESICGSNRVRLLAINPLLLTTLLLVKRWIGQLPTRRSVLYGKAIEVLLMTWNVEGYEPINPEEAIPQLAFVAFNMMKDGVQRISSKRLGDLIGYAREQMPEILGYTKHSVAEFIRRVESRSSILVLGGYDIEDGTLYPVYEFRHLTFQEYLTARAIVDGYYPGHKDSDETLKVIKPYLRSESWREVIPLVAVLSGRGVVPLVEHLVQLCHTLPIIEEFEGRTVRPRQKARFRPALLLGQCIADEIQIPPDLLSQSLGCVLRRLREARDVAVPIWESKYGEVWNRLLLESFMNCCENILEVGGTIGEIHVASMKAKMKENLSPGLVDEVIRLLRSNDAAGKASAALAIMVLAFERRAWGREKIPNVAEEDNRIFTRLGDELVPVVYSDIVPIHVAICWAFCWLGENRLWSPENHPDVIRRFAEIWKTSSISDVRYIASWAISSLPIVTRNKRPLGDYDAGLIGFVKEQLSKLDDLRDNSKLSPLILAYYMMEPFNDKELSELLGSYLGKYGELWTNFLERERNTIAMLQSLGEIGKAKLREYMEYREKKESTRERDSSKQTRQKVKAVRI